MEQQEKQPGQPVKSRLDKFHDELMADIKLSELNLHDRTLGAASIKTKWIRMGFEERKLLKKLIAHKKVKTDEYIAMHGRNGVPKLKTESEGVRSEAIQRIVNAIGTQQEVVDYIEQVIKVVLSSFSFDIKNSIDIVKIENS